MKSIILEEIISEDKKTTIENPDTENPIVIEIPKETAIAEDPKKAYRELLDKCKSVIQTVEKDTLAGYWELGRIANELKNDDRFVYGGKTVKTLAEDLGMSSGHLYKMMQFNKLFDATQFSNALETNMTWRHVTYLLSVKDASVRNKLIKSISEKGWTSDKVRKEVKKLKGKNPDGRGKSKQFTAYGFYSRLTKLGEWINPEFVESFDKGAIDVDIQQLCELEKVHKRIGVMIEKLR
jgi:hypothetical protein